ncbi:MAG: phage terminase family protein [Actinomycetota bacterium]|nr:phage terminase family protein [Actinomycetota bacterium]MDQ6947292.1 phage terminase family protein [Actinomycetota bacterium]
MDSYDALYRLVLDDGTRWADTATDWQQADADAVLSGQPPMHFQSRPRGGSKTTDQAGVALALLCTDAPPTSHSYSFAADRDQAGLLLDALNGFVIRTPGLDKLIKVDRWTAKNLRTGADLTVMPADGPGTYGLRPWLVTCDEVAQWPDDTAHRMVWEAVVSAMGKMPGARLVVITTAGAPDHWSAKVIEHARSSEQWRVNEVDGPLPWANPAFLAEQEALLLPSAYARLHLNRWSAPEDRLTTPEMLARLVRHPGPIPPEDGRSYVMGLDIGVVNDRTVTVVGHRSSGKLVVDKMRVWSGSKTNPVDLAQVEEEVAALSVLYNDAPVIYDPHQAVLLTQGLRRRGIRCVAHIFNQATNAQLAMALYQLISTDRIELPEDEALDNELSRVQIRETGPGLVRLDHANGQHDDRAVVLGMLAQSVLSAPPLRSGPRTRRVSYVDGPQAALAGWLSD